MCGIFAWADTLRVLDPKKMEELRDLLKHRGPDDYGLYISHDHHVSLTFRRLSIIDLSPAGHQPMSNEDQSIWITFNGEVYNYAEIRPELEARGHQFHSHTDTEVIIHSYEEWGERCVEKFIGMFAFVIWDGRNKTMFAARDRLGIKPLYYSVTAHRLLVASEIKPIIDAPDFDQKIDPLALQDYFARGYISSPHSIFRSVRSLRPGHFLIWNQESNNLVIDQYWNPVDFFSGSDNSEKYTEQEWLDKLETLLRSSIKYRLISDVPLGVFLSGGIDSSLVAALMRQVSNDEVKTFTIGFQEIKYNEADHAQKVAQHLGTAHTLLQTNHQDAQELICQLPNYYDEPFADSSQIPTYLVSKLARQYVTVALSGDGGDELFCGYETYQLMERWQYLWKLPQFIRSCIQNVAQLTSNERFRLAALGLELPDPLTFASYFTGIWRPHEIESLLPGIASQFRSLDQYSGLCYVQDSNSTNVLQNLMLIDLQRYLPNDVLTKVDRASMAVSLEARVPLLDHRIVEFALRMPISLKRHRGKSKYALRKILYRHVPRELIERPKQGFSVPLDDWLKTDLHDLVQKYLDPTLLRRQGLFNERTVSFQVDRFMAGQSGHSRIWTMIMFQMWAERYLGLNV